MQGFMLARAEQIEDIRKRLAVLQHYIQAGGKLNLTDANVHAEAFVRVLLNATFGWNLVTTNKSTTNYPCIDLLDVDRRIGIQVTAEKGSAKLTDTLECLERHKLSDVISNLKVMSLVAKQDRYTVSATSAGITFDWKVDVLDFTDVIKAAQAIENLDQLNTTAQSSTFGYTCALKLESLREIGNRSASLISPNLPSH